MASVMIGTPTSLQLHMENRPADTGVGFLNFNLALVRSFAQGQRRGDAIETLLLGDYLPVLLVHAGWWMQAADLAAGTLSENLREQLGALRAMLAEVLTLVPEAWAETFAHSRNATDISVAQTLLARYIRFRNEAYGLLRAALPNVELRSLARLA